MTPYDTAPPVSPQDGKTAAASVSSAFKRSGSQKRKRDREWRIALDAQEEAEALQRAKGAGLSKMAYGRLGLLGTPGPRAKRTPHIHAEPLARATAALNKIGNNFNQIAHVLNAGGATSTGQKYLDALEDVRLTLRAIREAAGRTSHEDDNQGEQAR